MSVTSTDESLPLGTTPILSDGDARDFFALLKPRVMSLVVFTALVGMLVAPGHINPAIGFIAILCIAIGGGASGALNMWYDADIDAVMGRTANRPIPAGRIEGSTALGFGLTLAAFSVVTLGLAANWLAAGLLAFTIFFYAVVYTIWLKRSTPQNIVIGGAAGALPPVIGWAAVTGNVTVESVVLFMIIFLWTPAHFWALALFKSGDYGKAGIPMMPNVVGEASTKRQMVVYAVLTAISGVLPAVMGFASFAYGAVALLLGAGFVWYSLAVLRMPEGDERMIPAKKLFGFSLLYLAIIFGALLVDAVVPQLLAMVL
ncbi:MAG: protoheme IX farnesyltransferase [Rhizobiales bacterium]|nr:protoheme IX farnesyltransferase [Hoeflea sp.]MBG21251.1 protoheme IX farnesyltransferase [Hyphomicrobiales bacterium]|tara:strand:- start:5336 stop:6283 length:948 start_codon:yes stop_codon:yes gene_type:complete